MILLLELFKLSMRLRIVGRVRSFVLKEIAACAACFGSTVSSDTHKWLLVGQNSKAEDGVQVV